MTFGGAPTRWEPAGTSRGVDDAVRTAEIHPVVAHAVEAFLSQT